MLSSSARQDWADTLARLRAEAAAYAKRAAQQRQNAISFRKRRRWLEALKADINASEYRRTRDQLKAEAAKIKEQWGFR